MYGNGFFATAAKQATKGSGTARLMVAWGKVTSAPKIQTWSKSKVSLSIGLGDDGYQKVSAWEDNPQVFDTLAALEKGDVIFVCGTRTDKTYNDSNGATKNSVELTADIVIPQAVISGAIALLSNSNIHNMLVDAQEEEPQEEAEDDPYEDFSAVEAFSEEVPFR